MAESRIIIERSVLLRSYKIQPAGVSCWTLLLLLLFTFTLSTSTYATASISDSRKTNFHSAIHQLAKNIRIRTTSTESGAVIRPTINTIIESSSSNSNVRKNNSNNYGKYRRHLHFQGTKDRAVMVSSVKTKAKKVKKQLRNAMQYTGSVGVYYGIDPKNMIPSGNHPRKPRPPKIEDSMVLALDELKMLRLEMEKMRMEIQQLKRTMIGDDADDSSSYYMDDESKAKALRKKQMDADKLAAEIELWANEILEEGEEDGWTPVECSKMIRASMNGTGRTTAFIKWMADSRADKADKQDQTLHPCIKCSSTIDAPLELVCAYLSRPEASANYNDVVDNFEDLEEISSNAKICWASSPQILFVKPRDFVTFCHHRWKSDGTQVIVNQACEHKKFPLEKEREGKSCRGYALRGVNILSRCSEDPSKTQITIVAHCRPGGGLPDWATKTAVKALAPIEPFKLFHKINDQVICNQDQLKSMVEENKKKGSTLPPGKTSRPGGFAQIGYACFWPDGGGSEEGQVISTAESHQNSVEDGDESIQSENESIPR